VVSVEQSEERSLRTGGTLDTSESEIRPGPFKIPQVPEQLLDPKGGSFTDGGELSRLEMGETKSGEISVLLGESGEAGDDNGELGKENSETFTEEDKVGVVGNIARGGSETVVSEVRESGWGLTCWMIPAASGATVPKVWT